MAQYFIDPRFCNSVTYGFGVLLTLVKYVCRKQDAVIAPFQPWWEKAEVMHDDSLGTRKEL